MREVAPTIPTVEGWSGYTKTPPQGSPNRVSISYFGTKRRLVIDAEVVKALKVLRAEGRIEIIVSVTPSVGSLKGDAEEGKEWMLCKGVLIETRDRDSDHFAALARPDLQYAWDNETDLEPRPESTKQGKKSKGRNGRQTQQTPQKKKQKRSTTVGDDHQSGDEDNDDASGDDEAEGSVAATTAADEEEEDEVPKVERSEEEMLVPSGPYNTLPPLFRLAQSSSGVDGSTVSDSLDASAPPQELVINVYLDKLAPLSEAKWLKTGDVEDWLSALPGFAHSRLSDQSWHQKIHVDDPDPPPTIFDVFADWGTKSFLGTGRDRRRFVLDCLSDSKGQVEILCRLVRGERASTVSSKELAVAGGSGKRNPLAEAAKMTSFTSHQTHLSLAVMAMFGLTAEYAEAAGEKQESFDGRISEILMGLPQNLVFKALDGLWKEVMEKNARVSAAAARSAASSIKSSAASASSKATPTSKQPTPVGPSTAGAPSQKRKASSGPAAEDASPSAKENGSGGAAKSTSPATPLQAAGQEGGSSSKKARSGSRNFASTPAAAGAAPSETISASSDASKTEAEAENGDEEEEEEDELESEALQEGRDEGAAHREDEGDEKTAAADAYADEAEGEEQADADEVDGDQEDGGDEEAEEEVEEEDEGEAPSVHVETHGPADEEQEGEGEAVVVLERDNGEEEEQG
ncbi:hypothetical protein BCV69DRAFT_280148 [Microstroma glucosiphilum]|uniref:Uncharacterized protein n=1 Tax=Pseudomicrostroma glucosiphilum TaxID=1684307 RepID=A0A316UH64_9BASI|nr:hypothetical protein BCV69DRAFT_280148 [Pseudomicrostroma glucosiphilum]PWN24258.1 hypothetical protein BCV69DRAFT_280148 [Pseudomicrostroma glucosiphilum]